MNREERQQSRPSASTDRIGYPATRLTQRGPDAGGDLTADGPRHCRHQRLAATTIAAALALPGTCSGVISISDRLARGPIMMRTGVRRFIVHHYQRFVLLRPSVGIHVIRVVEIHHPSSVKDH
jgi:hypothetical protein